jgi:acetamidase/formamidase
LAPKEADDRRLDSAELYRRQHRQLAHRQGRHDVLSGRGAEGGLLSVGDSHASQGDSELCGTAIECSLTGTFQIILHKKAIWPARRSKPSTIRCWRRRTSGWCTASASPIISPSSAHKAQSDIYSKSSVDLAMRDAFRKMRKFLMTTKKLTEDEAISLMSIAVDFGITQVVDGNWGVHAIIKKNQYTPPRT